MKKGKEKKKGKVSPKKESQRITAFFQAQGSCSQPVEQCVQTDSTDPAVDEEQSKYFQACENKNSDETHESVGKRSGPSKLARLSLRKSRECHVDTDAKNGPSTSSQSKPFSDVQVEATSSVKRKNDNNVENIGDLLNKKSKIEAQTKNHSLLRDGLNCIRDCDDQTVSSDNNDITEDPGMHSTFTSQVNINNKCDNVNISTTDSDSLSQRASTLGIYKGLETTRTESLSVQLVNTTCNKTNTDYSEKKTLQNSDSVDNEGENTKTTDDTEDLNNGEEAEEEEYRIPYYLENFATILTYVMNDEFYNYLFNDGDRETVKLFQNLTENGQKLYVRLFGRQYRWLRKSKIVYPKISEDLTTILEELVCAGLIVDETKLVDLLDILKALPVPDLKTLGKSLRLNTNQLREDLINAVIKHCSKSNISTFFKVKDSSKTSGTDQAVVQRAKKLLGSCYKLCKNGRSVFMRITMLFGLHKTQGEEDERGAGQAQLFQMLMSNIGKVKYPEYTVKRKTKVFESRESLQSFSAALQVEAEMVEALDKKDYDTALEYYEKANDQLGQLRRCDAAMRHDKSLPSFLSVYTSGAVYIRVLSRGVELFQFRKQYTDAVDQLKKLIQQELYHLDYRGRWYERLVLNLDHHLKKPAEALDYIKAGLNDPNIRAGHRYALFQRAQKICNAPSNKKLRKRWQEFSEDVMAVVAEAPKVHIKGKRLDNVAPGGFAMFVSEDSFYKGGEEVTFLKRVEDVALNYYKEEGYIEGLHAEGGIISLLFNLVMWDIIFCDDIPDVFYNLYQILPLDLYTEDFYLNRKTAIDEKLTEISVWTEEELCDTIEALWTKHYGTLCVGINWEMFSDVEQLKGLCQCMGASVITSVFDRMAKDRRFTRSGVPDLTVWNLQKKTFKIVEVKGPGDRLSTKQILWLDYLLNVGVKAEVCHVQAVGVKKIH